jgi:hypothetical protein
VALPVAGLEHVVLCCRVALEVVVSSVASLGALRGALESAGGVRCQPASTVLAPPAHEAAALACCTVALSSGVDGVAVCRARAVATGIASKARVAEALVRFFVALAVVAAVVGAAD